MFLLVIVSVSIFTRFVYLKQGNFLKDTPTKIFFGSKELSCRIQKSNCFSRKNKDWLEPIYEEFLSSKHHAFSEP